ncbi:SpoIIE family protein phosphatase [Georgenia halophila]|uniref:SpoIIE family protein phosphatase n=1 Tax=Georgenia halophila TaxID=620889 RepID=A0ABP8LAZ8_9MICO
MSARERSWERTPSGLLLLDGRGTVVDANATFLSWIGLRPDEVLGERRLSELFTAGGRIYWETHLAPMLHADGRVDEVAVELRADGRRMPVLLSALTSEDGLVHVALSSAQERSRYERELLAARRAAERAADRTTLLQGITSALSGSVGIDGVVAALLSQTVGTLGIPAGTIWLTDGRRLQPRTAAGEELGTAPPPRSGLEDVRAVGGRLEVPLRGHSALRGVLSLVVPDDLAGEQLDRAVFGAIGQQAGIALDRAALYEEKASLAHELQHSLLDVDLPADERFSIASAYRPGVTGLEVGGDFFDAFQLDDDVLAVTVGDVVGKGLGAAIAMGHLRSAVRALATRRAGPARLLEELDAFITHAPAAASATISYAEVDLSTGRLTFACAGHMPPALRREGGGTELLWEGRSMPLGVPDHARGQTALTLRPGDELLLYTDGLVERRDRPLREGLDVLTDAADQTLGRSGDVLAALMSRLLADDRHRDDVCLLLLSWTGD